MAEKITPRTKDFSQWYQDVVLQARLADYSPVKGCMVIRPNGYAIWERIQKELDQRFKDTGHQNAYFPLFIPESFLKKEADHVEGFAPQCAVVTYAGSKDLEEKLVVRPTSETIINSMFAKWIQSYRDLPMLINQWANVVRWEMRTRLFLRTTEFLWQEGHTCHETESEAEEEALKMLRVYKEFSENIMAVPVIAGVKTPSEKFAGANTTYCIEAMLQDNKALQAGTSHNLGQNFSKAFETKFQDRQGQWQFVYQTSWGVSTRLVGGLVMTHSDDKGLVIPPRLAATHVVIVPIVKGIPEDAKLFEVSENLEKQIKAETKNLPYTVQVKIDRDTQHSAGWKFHEYELTGIPLRIEIGPRDLAQNNATLVRRDTSEKKVLPLDQIASSVAVELQKMQKDLFDRAKALRTKNSHLIDDYEKFKTLLEAEGGFLHAHWCTSASCEATVKNETKATIRCIPLDSEDLLAPADEKGSCIKCGEKSPRRVIFAKSY